MLHTWHFSLGGRSNRQLSTLSSGRRPFRPAISPVYCLIRGGRPGKGVCEGANYARYSSHGLEICDSQLAPLRPSTTASDQVIIAGLAASQVRVERLYQELFSVRRQGG